MRCLSRYPFLLPCRTTRKYPFQYASVVLSRHHTSKELQHDPITQLERDARRILTIVRGRIEERAKLLLELNPESSAREDIQRAKRIKELEPLQSVWNEWQRAKESLQETIVLLNDTDPSMRSLAVEEYDSLTGTLNHHLRSSFPSLLTPKSSTSQLSALIELKSGVGGLEASLFLGDVLKMYLRLAHQNRWRTKLLEKNEQDSGGFKYVILEVVGEGAYDALQWESGVHRVQRVPLTEASGRVHTSTIAVIVLPLLNDVSDASAATDLYEEKDVRVEVMRARGAGGQHVNKTESAVRLTHIPTGITVSMQDERSQHTNKAKAYQILRARLLDRKLTAEMVERRETRRQLVKSADRSEKVRTYNYAQDRVTDHRIGLTVMNLTLVMEGDGLQNFIDALKKEHDEAVMEDFLDQHEAQQISSEPNL